MGKTSIGIVGLAALASAFAFACSQTSADDGAATDEAHLNATMSDLCGGGTWSGPRDFASIGGSFERATIAPFPRWPAPAPGAIALPELQSIAFENVTKEHMARWQGDIARTLAGGATEVGTFEAVPGGAAFADTITLTPAASAGAPAVPEMYFVYGVQMAGGQISAVCLVRPYLPAAPPPFVLRRSGSSTPGDAGTATSDADLSSADAAGE